MPLKKSENFENFELKPIRGVLGLNELGPIQANSISSTIFFEVSTPWAYPLSSVNLFSQKSNFLATLRKNTKWRPCMNVNVNISILGEADDATLYFDQFRSVLTSIMSKIYLI